MKFPPHFSSEELTRSQTATRNDIDNSPDEKQLNNLVRMAWFLESLRMRIRMVLGKKSIIIVSSGFRCEKLNLIIGGSKTSAHMKGLAADITCPDLTPLELAEFIRDNMADESFDQVIHEFGKWVHVGLCSGLPRYEELTALRENGKTVYKKGLV
jgi:hypothetical protein